MSAPDLTPQQIKAIDHMFSELEDGTYYGLLNISHDADADTVQKAYYNLSRQWHPDRFFRKSIGEYADRIEMVFVGITQAYQTIKNPDKRKAYDRDLRESGRIPRSSGRAAPPPTRSTSTPDKTSTAQAAGSPGKSSLRERLDARRRDVPTRRSTTRVRKRAESKIRDHVRTQLAKARTFYEQGQQDYQAGRIIKAAGALELAVQFDPRNDEYKALHEVAKADARRVRVQQLTMQGEQAESYQQYKQAIHAYREAVALEPEEGKVYHRLSRLVRHEEDDDREALNLLREAVIRDPDVLDYRMALGELYAELGLKLNARREFQEVLKRDKGYDAAKAALKSI